MKRMKALLSHYPKLYHIMAQTYRYISNTLMRFHLAFTKVKYLNPKSPSGPFKAQFGQDFYLHELGLLQNKKFFVEVGCNEPVHNSNSYALEHSFGFTGISVDALDFSEQYSRHRPNTLFVCALIDPSKERKKFYSVLNDEGWENQISSVHAKTLETGKGFKAKTVFLKTKRLSEVVPEDKKIDLLLIDVEGHEIAVLNTLDWNSNTPDTILIENNGLFFPRKKLQNYLWSRGYRLLARIGTIDDIYVKR